MRYVFFFIIIILVLEAVYLDRNSGYMFTLRFSFSVDLNYNIRSQSNQIIGNYLLFVPQGCEAKRLKTPKTKLSPNKKKMFEWVRNVRANMSHTVFKYGHNNLHLPISFK